MPQFPAGTSCLPRKKKDSPAIQPASTLLDSNHGNSSPTPKSLHLEPLVFGSMI